MKKISPLAAAVVLASSIFTQSASAEVEDAFVRLRAATEAEERYTVPAGKILIIQSLSHKSTKLVDTPGPIILRIGKRRVNVPNSTLINEYTLGGTYASEEIVPLRQPLRLKEGEYIEMPIGSAGSDSYYLFGLMADEGDLFAKIPVELTNPRLAGGALMADITYGSPRPRVTKVETSTDLKTFTEEPKATVTSGSSTTAVAKIDVDKGQDKTFVRVTATPRRK